MAVQVRKGEQTRVRIGKYELRFCAICPGQRRRGWESTLRGRRHRDLTGAGSREVERTVYRRGRYPRLLGAAGRPLDHQPHLIERLKYIEAGPLQGVDQSPRVRTVA